MKVLAIRGRNIASLEAPFEIDFKTEPLLSAGIFAITGPTGAGKSSLLDALCLALFNKTPRHKDAAESGIQLADGTNKIGQGDIRSILRKGAAEGYAEVEFEGQDKQIYKAKWTVKRARNLATGKLQDATIELVNQTSGLPFGGKNTETLKEIERVLGLNFTQFTRSVLLAQGEFTAFLKAEKDEKSALLEKLTGTEIYTKISERIYEKTSLARQSLEQIEAQMGNLSLLNEELFLEKQNQLVGLKNEIVQLEISKQQTNQALEWFTTHEKLETSIKLAQNDLLESTSAKEKAESRIGNFILIEKVQDARQLVEAKTQTIMEIGLKQEQANLLNRELKDLNLIVDSTQHQVESKTQLLQQKEQECSDTKPKLEKARQLDILIIEKQKSLSEAKQALVETNNKYTLLNQNLTIQLASFDVLNQNASKLILWKQEHIGRKLIAEQEKFILGKLADAKQGLEKKISLELKVKEQNELRDSLSKDIKSKKLEIENFEVEINELKRTNAAIEASLVGIDIFTLQTEADQKRNTHKDLFGLKQAWDRLYEKQLQLHDFLEKSEANEKALDKWSVELENKSKELFALKSKKEQTEKLLNLAKLSVAKDVEVLRAQLVPDDECPVCGSKDHPFATHAGLQVFADTLAIEYDALQNNYQNLLLDCNTLENGLKSLIKEKNELKSTIQSLQDLLLVKETEWNGMPYSSEYVNYQAPKRSQHLAEAINAIELKAEALTATLNNHQLKLVQWNSGKDKLSKEQEKLNFLILNIAEMQNKFKLIEQSAAKLTVELNEEKLKLENLTQELNPFFTQPEWSEKWRQDTDLFVNKLKGFAADWNQKNEELALLEVTLQNRQIELENQQKQISEAHNLKELAIEKHNSRTLEFEKLNKERSSFWSGKPAKEVEAELEAERKNLAEQTELCKQQLQENMQLRSAKNGQKQEIETEIERLTKLLVIHKEQLSNWISIANLSSPKQIDETKLIAWLNYSPAWILEERKAIQDLDNAILQASTTLQEREKQYIRHEKARKSEISKEELILNTVVIENNLKLVSDSCFEVDRILKNDSENKQKAANYLVDIGIKRHTFEQWAKLNDLIGSADGRKFRQIAQEYTLEVLLSYANIHLQDLAPRYKLQVIANSLAMQVVDTDMGDEIRSVYSLSGGESFLVSLALALGLASLSSNQMKVESLFIDEGFGSLDPATLTLAMDALENLQNKGRKVGVISHVQEMTDRIQVQVKVQKLANGRSKVVVN